MALVSANQELSILIDETKPLLIVPSHSLQVNENHTQTHLKNVSNRKCSLTKTSEKKPCLVKKKKDLVLILLIKETESPFS